MNTVHSVYIHVKNAVTASSDVNRKLKQKTLKQRYKNLQEKCSLYLEIIQFQALDNLEPNFFFFLFSFFLTTDNTQLGDMQGGKNRRARPDHPRSQDIRFYCVYTCKGSEPALHSSPLCSGAFLINAALCCARRWNHFQL